MAPSNGRRAARTPHSARKGLNPFAPPHTKGFKPPQPSALSFVLPLTPSNGSVQWPPPVEAARTPIIPTGSEMRSRCRRPISPYLYRYPTEVTLPIFIRSTPPRHRPQPSVTMAPAFAVPLPVPTSPATSAFTTPRRPPSHNVHPPARRPLHPPLNMVAPAAPTTSQPATVQQKPIKKLLIANRGEIAIRVIRACAELAIPSVAVYSQADRDALHVSLADQAICIGDAPSATSYLCVPNILAAAAVTGADAVHPGYGFLSENAEFADICAAHGLRFVGPSPNAISKMGDKATAKETMLEAGVPCVPGSRGVLASVQEAIQLATQLGYPLMLKATAGGGGRGIKIVNAEGELQNAFKTCSAEAQAAFSDGGLYMERYVQAPRHVEIQVLADNYGNCVHLGERDCSVQRRNQKLIEEAPSPALNEDLRERMGKAAVDAAKAIGYRGAGTVEFLLDRDGQFYFMEMNTRIQVEHPVTEAITGVDLIQQQIRVAEGHELAFEQKDICLNGHAIEARINAEDPAHNFRPMPGKVTGFLPPGGIGVRWDGQVFTGWRIPPNYDSLLGKLIVWAPTRREAIQRLKRALNETAVQGVPTTIAFHLRVVENDTFVKGEEIYTNFIETERLLEQLRG
ncbi:Biotin carboxylase [Gracilariopsis chorda]|uniref:Biotin carboxylase n=1 Tax=Gracilariopsis chorda TaxID=448386 RepID=A0A2V3IT23_9FLOR|nr:Biotin carboxylase [Gracilariopsis chorda]|eukprot:PXF45264.1 Biotin carboxylase [Gracilariopsis chorda]